MKIKNKITFIFVILVASMQLVIFSIIYFFAVEYRTDEFFEKLKKRTLIAEQSNFEKDALSVEIYEELRRKHLQILPDEKEFIFNISTPLKDIRLKTQINIPQKFYSDLINKSYAEAKAGKSFFSGLKYKDQNSNYLIILTANDDDGINELSNLRTLLIFLFLLNIIVLLLLGRFFAKRALDPLTKIIEKVNNIRVTNLHERLQTTQNKDELSQLASTFNGMLDRLETSFDIQSNFINNASHELKNPLTAILGQTEIALLKERSPQEYTKVLEGVETEALRLDALINSLLKFAQTENDEKGLLITPIRLDELILEVKGNIDLINPDNNIEIDFNDFPENPDLLVIEGNYGLINIALNNVLDNASKFSDNKKVIVKIVTNTSAIKIVVTDQGVGIPTDEIKNIYQPFYRAANVRNVKGYGFGLPLTYKIMKLHSGTIEVFSEHKVGTIVTLIFPNKHQNFSISR
ncbi:HAMP domain-containing sensor histidine kinase [uncultured Formosa sp.]|uniref:sensor histidine kinase n=1 Tax=uncultured Formosa sp. TaxID=255435 RepID=UPI00261F1EA3|nr:HAMP domain-containing sensor histidine kinase [uncultured Formosa sp.]